MKVSTKTRYGLRAMVDLATHYSGKPVQIKEIAVRQNLSENYLEQIMLTLKKAGLVASLIGAGGGYILTRKPEEINALQIVEVLEGSLSPVPCVEHEQLCTQEKHCITRKLWIKVQKSIREVLASATLKDLVEGNLEEEYIYQI